MRIRHPLFAAVAVALSLAVAVPADAAAVTAATGEMVTQDETRIPLASAQATFGPFFLSFYHSGKCADVPGPTTAHVWLDQWTCLAQNNERWYLDVAFNDQEGTWYRVRNAWSGQCMNVGSGSTAWKAPIIQYPCGNYQNALFLIWRTGSMPVDYYFFEARHSGLVINVNQGSTALGAKLIQYGACYCANEYIRVPT